MKNKGIGALAEQIASKGRNGDSLLMHIQPEELAGIAALLGQDLTINPETGMPEAFSWKKLLGAIGLGAGATALIAMTGGAGAGFLKPLASLGAKLALTKAGAATGLGTLLKTAAVPALISGAAGQAVGAFAPDPKKQDQQTLGQMQQYIDERNKQQMQKMIFPLLRQINLYQPTQQEQQAQQQGQPPIGPGGIASTLQTNTPGYAEGGSLEPEEEKAQQIIRDAMDAIRGEGDDPESALNTYLAYYGKDALQDLYKRMSGDEEQEGEEQPEDEEPKAEGMVKGPGNGMDDMATARMAHGGQKVLLSNDEFIIPADVVSGLGDGSSEAGARKLYAMMDRVRMDRTGTKNQPGKIKDSRVLPA
jgi:hypothetical protein